MAALGLWLLLVQMWSRQIAHYGEFITSWRNAFIKIKYNLNTNVITMNIWKEENFVLLGRQLYLYLLPCWTGNYYKNYAERLAA